MGTSERLSCEFGPRVTKSGEKLVRSPHEKAADNGRLKERASAPTVGSSLGRMESVGSSCIKI